MKCWKCGQDNIDGASVCTYCGVSQKRPAPVTEAGRAMRTLYDRYGAQEVLKNNAYLVNGLGDLAEDSKKLRNQLKTGMDAGLGRVYLEQLKAGAPDSAFDRRVKRLLTEEAGLNDKTAVEIMDCFDEMIGWRAVQRPQAGQQAQQQAGQSRQPQTVQPNPEKKVPGSDEIDRRQQNAVKEPEIDRGKALTDQQNADKTDSVDVSGKKKVFFAAMAADLVLLFCVYQQIGAFSKNEPNKPVILGVLIAIVICFLLALYGKGDPFTCGLCSVIALVATFFGAISLMGVIGSSTAVVVIGSFLTLFVSIYVSRCAYAYMKNK